MATRLAEGNSVDITPVGAVSAGDVVAIGSNGIVGVAESDIAAGAKGSLAIKGIFRVTKAEPTDVFALGGPVSFSSSEAVEVSTTPGTYTAYAVKASGATDTTVDVCINGATIIVT